MAIEVPDWYRTVALVGQDGAGTPRVVLLDSAGRIMAVLYGAVSISGDVNVTQESSIREIQGVDGVTLHTIAVDSLGRIIALIYGSYAGVMTPAAVDASGRMIMIPTDPADVWGNAISMGNAELAAVLSFAKRFDRRGSIYWLDGFESGLAKWDDFATETGASVVISSEFAGDGAYSVKLTAGSDITYSAGIFKGLSYPVAGRFGLEVSFTLDDDTTKVQFDLFVYDGTNEYMGRVWYDYGNSKITYLNSSNVETDLATGITLYQPDNTIHTIKFVVDGVNHTYVRLMLAGVEYDMSALDLRSIVSALAPHLTVQVYHIGQSGLNPAIYVDNVVVTHQEPANA